MKHKISIYLLILILVVISYSYIHRMISRNVSEIDTITTYLLGPSIEIDMSTGKAEVATDSITRSIRLDRPEMNSIEALAQIALQDYNPQLPADEAKTQLFPGDFDWNVEIKKNDGIKCGIGSLGLTFLRKRNFVDTATYIRFCDLSDLIVNICNKHLKQNQRLKYASPFRLIRNESLRSSGD